MSILNWTSYLFNKSVEWTDNHIGFLLGAAFGILLGAAIGTLFVPFATLIFAIAGHYVHQAYIKFSALLSSTRALFNWLPGNADDKISSDDNAPSSEAKPNQAERLNHYMDNGIMGGFFPENAEKPTPANAHTNLSWLTFIGFLASSDDKRSNGDTDQEKRSHDKVSSDDNAPSSEAKPHQAEGLNHYMDNGIMGGFFPDKDNADVCEAKGEADTLLKDHKGFFPSNQPTVSAVQNESSEAHESYQASDGYDSTRECDFMDALYGIS